MKGFALAGSLLLAVGAAQAGTAVTLTSTDLKEQPAADAAKLESLSENTKLDVSEQRGKWTKAKTPASKTGWVSVFSLRADGEASSAAGNKTSAIDVFGRKSANTTTGTVARGMTAADMENAVPDMAELQKMQKYATAKDEAKRFGQQSKLNVSSVEYIKDTSSSSNSGSGATSQTPVGM